MIAVTAGALVAVVAATSHSFQKTHLTPVRVNTFPTARSLPFFVGIEKGFFTNHGVALDLEFTESSRAQREGLAAGRFQVVHSAVDNAIAMVEQAGVDVVIVSGGDGGTNEVIVSRDISAYEDIRGKALVTDAPNTAYALQAKKILARHGLAEGEYRNNPVGAGPFRLKAMLEGGDNAIAIMNLPFSAQAIEAGMKSLGRTIDLLGPYQAGGAFVLRAWAQANPKVLESYLAGYVQSLRWVLDTAHRDEAIAILMEKRLLSRGLATRSYNLMIEPAFGFNPDAQFDAKGFDNVLALRQEIEGGPALSAADYLDLSYSERAITVLAGK